MHIYIHICAAMVGIRSEATSRFIGDPETLDATHTTDSRLHMTHTQDFT